MHNIDWFIKRWIVFVGDTKSGRHKLTIVVFTEFESAHILIYDSIYIYITKIIIWNAVFLLCSVIFNLNKGFTETHILLQIMFCLSSLFFQLFKWWKTKSVTTLIYYYWTLLCHEFHVWAKYNLVKKWNV